jgi:hypothetical protein
VEFRSITADSFRSFSCAQLAAFDELGGKLMCFAFGTSLASRSCAYPGVTWWNKVSAPQFWRAMGCEFGCANTLADWLPR